MSNQNKATKAIHEGHLPSETQSSRAIPIHQTTGYVFNNTDHAANLFNLSETGFIYTRLNNPTLDILEKRLAAIEGGIAAAVFASGTSATVTTLLTILQSGDHIVASNSLYGGTYNLLKVTLPRLGIKTTFVESDDISNFSKAIKNNTKLIFLESVGNPKVDVIDIESVSKVAKSNKIPLIVDNTVATPFLLNPIKYGANLVIHSLTKYIGGHGNSLGGAVIDAGTFDWGTKKFPLLSEPSEAYHGLVYSEVLGNAAFIAKVRTEGLRDLGASLSPLSAYSILQGLETLPLRIKKHSENALELAKWLEKNDAVAWVNYPGLKSSKYNNLARKYLSKGQSGILTFGLKGGFVQAKKTVDSVSLFSLVANIGDAKSLIIHPASTTHQQLKTEEQKTTGVTDDLIRISVGIEAIEDIIYDLNQAIQKSKKA